MGLDYCRLFLGIKELVRVMGETRGEDGIVKKVEDILPYAGERITSVRFKKGAIGKERRKVIRRIVREYNKSFVNSL